LPRFEIEVYKSLAIRQTICANATAAKYDFRKADKFLGFYF